MKSFDPFEILDISPDATKSEIKKAFRKKSLETHPDKNKDDPLAASKFLQVTRAHQALTDEDAIDNYKKYGNPDGPGPMKVAIGLPHFLMKKENQIAGLCISFLIILVIIPSAFFFWYSGSYIYTDKGLQQDDERRFAMTLNEQIPFQDLVKIVGWASDLETIKIKNQSELEYLMKLNNDILNNKGPKVNPKSEGIMKNFKTHMLLMIYMFRGDPKNQQYHNEIKEILKKVPSMIELWIEISLSLHFQYRARRTRKNMSFKAMATIINFSQHVIQGMWEFQSELLQLPHMDEDTITKIMKKMKKKTLKLKEYIELNKEERAAHEVLSAEQMGEVEKVIECLPRIKLIPVLVTEGSDDIVVNDVVTVKVKVIREELGEHEKAPPVCSRTHPYMQVQKYFVFLTDSKDTNIFAQLRFKDIDQTQEQELKFQAPPTMIGNCLMHVHCFGDSYIGLDVQEELKFTVMKESETREDYKYDDEDIKREPTLFEQALQGLNEENSDDDLEEEEEDDTNATFDSKKKTAQVGSDEELEEEKDD